MHEKCHLFVLGVVRCRVGHPLRSEGSLIGFGGGLPDRCRTITKSSMLLNNVLRDYQPICRIRSWMSPL
jgi:hypothetical protein